MTKKSQKQIYSGADPEEVFQDLQPLVDFQDDGLSVHTLEKLIHSRLLPHLMQYNHPGFNSLFNFFPEEGAELGAEIALAHNQGVTNWQVSPGGAALEELCCQALCRLFGFPPEADATFMYSGTYANQQALYLALHRKAEKHGFDYSQKGLDGFPYAKQLRVLCSRDAHFSLKHAVRILGLGEESLVPLDVDKNRRLDVDQMKKICEDPELAGNIFCVVATAGTTSTGSVDPVLPVIKVCQELETWIHVDGAYGLAYSLIPELKQLFSGIERADSVSWDPHKQFGVPIPSSILFVKQKEDFQRMAIYSEYFNRKDDPRPNPGLKSPPSTRPFSALPLVTSLRFLGLKRAIERLRAPIQAVKELAKMLHKEAEIEVVHRPDTGILCFRIVPEGYPEAELDKLQEFVHESINEKGKYSLAITKLDKKTVLRIVALSPSVTSKTLMDTVEEALVEAQNYSESAKNS
jgi:L-2,4-diaminobutyrate decarboxylase